MSSQQPQIVDQSDQLRIRISLIILALPYRLSLKNACVLKINLTLNQTNSNNRRPRMSIEQIIISNGYTRYGEIDEGGVKLKIYSLCTRRTEKKQNLTDIDL